MILERLDLLEAFDTLVDGNHITLSKPDPEVFLMGAKALGIHPAECLVFEDAQAGIDAALAGGFPVVGIGQVSELSRAKVVIPGFSNYKWSDVLRELEA